MKNCHTGVFSRSIPSRIVVDIFGATSNTNWITQRSSTKEIKNAYYEQTEDDVFRVIIELKHPQHWGYSIYYQGKRLVIKVKRQPEGLSLKKLKVAVDAGHGGDNNGATGGTTGIQEKKLYVAYCAGTGKTVDDKESFRFYDQGKRYFTEYGGENRNAEKRRS
jgi:N-acetylmuramoyl-L-alanine amidase